MTQNGHYQAEVSPASNRAVMFELEEAKGALQAMSLAWVVLEDYLVVMKSRDGGVQSLFCGVPVIWKCLRYTSLLSI